MRGRSKPLARTGGVSFLPSARVAPAHPRTSAQNPESHLRGYMRSGASRAGSTSFNVAPPRDSYARAVGVSPGRRSLTGSAFSHGRRWRGIRGGRLASARGARGAPLTAKSASACQGRGAPSWPGSLGGKGDDPAGSGRSLGGSGAHIGVVGLDARRCDIMVASTAPASPTRLRQGVNARPRRATTMRSRRRKPAIGRLRATTG